MIAELTTEYADAPVAELASWEIVDYIKPDCGKGRKPGQLLRIEARDGRVGYYVGGCDADAIRAALPQVERHDLMDHEGMYARFCAARVTNPGAHAWDLACWDMRARAAAKPLWQLFGSATSERTMMYGDVRWGWFNDVDAFADCVRYRREEEGMEACKLHLPGTWGTPWGGGEAPGLKTTMACLEAARKAVGDDFILAYDPFSPEFFHFDEDMQIVDLLADCGYEWHEGGMPELPEDSRLPKYAELCAHAKERGLIIEPEGRWGPDDDPSEDDKTDEDIDVVARYMRYAEAGAGHQFHYDVQTCRGLTAGLRLYNQFAARADLEIRINFHWNWQPHQHLAFMTDPAIAPYLETSSPAGVDGNKDGAWLLPPDWPGCYRIDWDYVQKNRA